MAPADLKAKTTPESNFEISVSLKALQLNSVLNPSTWIISLIPTGMPWSGPKILLSITCCSRNFAISIAFSKS